MGCYRWQKGVMSVSYYSKGGLLILSRLQSPESHQKVRRQISQGAARVSSLVQISQRANIREGQGKTLSTFTSSHLGFNWSLTDSRLHGLSQSNYEHPLAK